MQNGRGFNSVSGVVADVWRVSDRFGFPTSSSKYKCRISVRSDSYRSEAVVRNTIAHRRRSRRPNSPTARNLATQLSAMPEICRKIGYRRVLTSQEKTAPAAQIRASPRPISVYSLPLGPNINVEGRPHSYFPVAEFVNLAITARGIGSGFLDWL